MRLQISRQPRSARREGHDMGTTIMLFAVGLAGSFVFDRFHLPGGAMTGAMIAVVIFKSCETVERKV